MKSAGIVKKVLTNAMANARNKGFEPDVMFVIHAAANKTEIAQRAPSKGVLYMGAGYGYATARRSNIEFAKVEIGLAKGSEKGLSENMKERIKAAQKTEAAKPVSLQKAKKQIPKQTKPKEPKKQTDEADKDKQRQQSRQQIKVPKKPKEGLPQKAEQ
jgi:hypothetical protein